MAFSLSAEATGDPSIPHGTSHSADADNYHPVSSAMWSYFLLLITVCLISNNCMLGRLQKKKRTKKSKNEKRKKKEEKGRKEWKKRKKEKNREER